MNIFMKMGNLLGTPKQKPLTIHDLTVKVGDYRTINEGDPEMKEDPEFPLHMMKEALDNNNTIEGNIVQGTYVYYPNKRKPKMWIGNYKILNPEDILCKSIAAKIGMSEIEWKNSIEKKRRDSEEDGMKKGKEYPSFSNIMEQKDTIKSIIENSNLQYEYNTEYMNNDNIPFDSYKYNYNESNIKQNSLHLDESIEKPINEDNSYYPYETNYNNNMYDNTSYVKKLNEEIEQIREEQVKIIEKQRDDILHYSNSQANQIIQINNENEEDEKQQQEEKEEEDEQNEKQIEYISEKIDEDNLEITKSITSTPEKRKSILKKKNLYTIKPVFLQNSNMKKNDKPKKGYTTLTSMSTKTSLALNDNSHKKIKNPSTGIIRNPIY